MFLESIGSVFQSDVNTDHFLSDTVLSTPCLFHTSQSPLESPIYLLLPFSEGEIETQRWSKLNSVYMAK